jgi:imidazoleglycerol-phosphate dehydratase/histidinol-phosphatase
MKILVTPQAASPLNNGFLFRDGFILAVSSLIVKNHFLGSDLNRWEADQLTLLRQEQLKIHQLAQLDADVIVDSNDVSLSVLDHDLEILHTSDNWSGIVRYLLDKRRVANRKRTTKETDIYVKVDLDGTGKSTINTGIPFFDHMLEQISRHGFIDIEISCTGDLHIDEHHTIEDVAIALGECLHEALGDKKGIERYGFVLAMDEALATVALDLSGRPYLVFEADLKREKVGDFPTEMTKHFFYSLAMGLRATLNISSTGENDHHVIEAIFKGFARTLKQAVAGNPRDPNTIPSSKGTL